MTQGLTNSKLAQLLSSLGFESGPAKQAKFLLWRHPASGCEFVLPANKAQESPRLADLEGIKAHLNLQGHLEEEAFDLFAAEGRLPADVSKRS